MAYRLFLCTLLALLLSSCGVREPAVITPPKDAAAAIEPFLAAVAKGDAKAAAKLTSSAAQDELAQSFAADHKKLAQAGKLTPRFIIQSENRAKDQREITLVYAAKKQDLWTSAAVRIYRYRSEPYRVEYWRITNSPPAPPLPSGISAEDMRFQQQMMSWVSGAIALFAVAGLALLLWLLKRKPHLVVPDAPDETRQAASTYREA